MLSECIYTSGGGAVSPIGENQSVTFVANVEKTITLSKVKTVSGGFLINTALPKYFSFWYDGSQWQTWQSGSGIQLVAVNESEVKIKYDGSYTFDSYFYGSE